MKKILVISHERSGTHFLMDSISLNTDYNSSPWQDVYCKDSINPNDNYKQQYKQQIELFFAKHYSIETKMIYKSHHQFYYFDNIMDKILENFHVIYVYREPKDVLCSCFKYFNLVETNAFPKNDNIHEFLYCCPYNYGYDGAYSYITSSNMVERIYNHYNSYIKRKNIYFISYHSLKTDFQQTMIKLANNFNIGLKNDIIKPELTGICPNKGVENNYKTILNNEDIKYIDDKNIDIKQLL